MILQKGKSFFLILILMLCAFTFLNAHWIYMAQKDQNSNITKDSAPLIETLLKTNPFFNKILQNPAKYEVQIIYTQINRDKENKPSFKEYTYRVNANEYFNPASFVKLPTILVALEKMNELKTAGISLETRVAYDSAYTCQRKIVYDTSSPTGYPSMGFYIKKALIASDDDAYNRLYEFVGQQRLNERLWQMGYPKICIMQRFQNCCMKCNRYTNPISFYNETNSVFYQLPMQINPNEYHNPLGTVLKGNEHIGMNGQLIRQPKDYSYSNNLPLQDLHDILISALFPEAVSSDKRFNLSDDQIIFLKKYMPMLPRESDIKMFKNVKVFPDDYKKYFLWESLEQPFLRSYNVNAYSYGYMGDCAYIVDNKNKVEFILLAVINTNETQSIQPKNYQYTTLGHSFLKNLGKTIYDFEVKRRKTNVPD